MFNNIKSRTVKLGGNKMRNISVLNFLGQELGIVMGNVMHLGGNDYQITFGGNNNANNFNIINAINLNTWLRIDGGADIYVVKRVLGQNGGGYVVIAKRHRSRN